MTKYEKTHRHFILFSSLTHLPQIGGKSLCPLLMFAIPPCLWALEIKHLKVKIQTLLSLSKNSIKANPDYQNIIEGKCEKQSNHHFRY